MKKKLFFAAIALTALASCTSDEFVGNSPQTSKETNGAISFNMSTPAVTRASGVDAASALGNSFNVYGTKTVTGTSGDEISNVFATNTYAEATTGDASAGTYTVSWSTGSGGSATSNTSGWDYVTSNQTIKYWDYSAKTYEFVAYKATVGSPTIAKYRKDGFTVTASAAQLAGLYIADKITLNNTGGTPDVNNSPTKPATGYNKIGNIVQFTFRSSGTKVRLGIYETIPGYVVQNVNFRPNGTVTGFTDATTANAKLTGSFNGSSSSAEATYDVTYGPHAIFTRNSSATDFRSSYFDFGTFDSSTAIGTSSTAPTWAGAIANPSNAPYYQSVLPNTDNVANMILYVDYVLYNSVSGETIKVKGAKAVVPSMYMKWNPNYAYTYLFKISDNTNGTTGTEGTSPEGLFPITFDAVTVAATDGAEVGTITTVSTPAITTYQNGSVSSTGITYATATETQPIYITVNTDGILASLTTDNTKLYTVPTGTTEADLILGTVPAANMVAVTGANALSILSTSETVQGITFANGTSAKFTPENNKTYAIEYYTPAVLYADVSEYNTAKGTSLDTSSFDSLTNEQKTKTPAFYQYKIIIVGNPT